MTNTAQNIRVVPLVALRDGHSHPSATINARSTGTHDGIAQLAASIREEGLLQSLLVCKASDPVPDDLQGVYFVIDGNRRLAALHVLQEAGTIDGAYAVPVMLQKDIQPIDALRKSLTANIEKLPLHPVDQYEVFERTHNTGETPAEIAARYGINEKLVLRRLALAQLDVTVRNGWRAGEIDAGQAMIFTLQPDQAIQAKAYRKLKKSKASFSDWQIKQEILCNKDATAELKFVGHDAYVAAGGAVNTDLFADIDPDTGEEKDGYAGKPTEYASDGALLKKMVHTKLQHKCDELIAAGWSWASPTDDLPSNHHYAWKILAEGKKATVQQRAASGCAVGLDNKGQLSIVYGLVKPGVKVPKKKKKAKPGEVSADAGAEVKEATISQALRRSLTDQMTSALAQSLRQHETVALAALCAGLLSWGQVCTVSARGHASDSQEPEDFEDAFARMLTMTTEQHITILANVAADALSFTTGDRAISIVAAALPAETVNQEIIKAFRASEYFDGAPKSVLLEAIGQTLGAAEAKYLQAKKKNAIAAYALQHLVPAGWLPPELHTPHYSAQKAPDASEGPGDAESKKTEKSKSKTIKRSKI